MPLSWGGAGPCLSSHDTPGAGPGNAEQSPALSCSRPSPHLQRCPPGLQARTLGAILFWRSTQVAVSLRFHSAGNERTSVPLCCRRCSWGIVTSAETVEQRGQTVSTLDLCSLDMATVSKVSKEKWTLCGFHLEWPHCSSPHLP